MLAYKFEERKTRKLFFLALSEVAVYTNMVHLGSLSIKLKQSKSTKHNEAEVTELIPRTGKTDFQIPTMVSNASLFLVAS